MDEDGEEEEEEAARRRRAKRGPFAWSGPLPPEDPTPPEDPAVLPEGAATDPGIRQWYERRRLLREERRALTGSYTRPLPPDNDLLHRFQSLYRNAPSALTAADRVRDTPRLRGVADEKRLAREAKRAKRLRRKELARLRGLTVRQWILEHFRHIEGRSDEAPLSLTMDVLRKLVRERMELVRERHASAVGDIEVLEAAAAEARPSETEDARARRLQRLDEGVQRRTRLREHLENELYRLEALLRLECRTIDEPADLSLCNFDRLYNVFYRCSREMHDHTHSAKVPFELVECAHTLRQLQRVIDTRLLLYHQRQRGIIDLESPDLPIDFYVRAEIEALRERQRQMRARRAAGQDAALEDEIMMEEGDEDGDEPPLPSYRPGGGDDASASEEDEDDSAARPQLPSRKRPRPVHKRTPPTDPRLKARKTPYRIMITRYSRLRDSIQQLQAIVVRASHGIRELQDAYGPAEAALTLGLYDPSDASNQEEGRGMLRLDLPLANHRLAIDPAGGHHQYLMRLRHSARWGEFSRKQVSGGKRQESRRVPADGRSRDRYRLITGMMPKAPAREQVGFRQTHAADPGVKGDVDRWVYYPDSGPTRRTWRADAEPLVQEDLAYLSTDYDTPKLPEVGTAQYDALMARKPRKTTYRTERRQEARLMERARRDTARFRCGARDGGDLPRGARLLWDSSKAQLQFWLMERNEAYGIVDYVRLCSAQIPDTLDGDNFLSKTVLAEFYDDDAAARDLAPLWSYLRALDPTGAATFPASWTLDHTRRGRATVCLQVLDPDRDCILEVYFKPQTAMIYVMEDFESIKAWVMRRMRAWQLAVNVLSSGRMWVRKSAKSKKLKMIARTGGSTPMAVLMENESKKLARSLKQMCEQSAAADKDAVAKSLAYLHAYVTDVIGVSVGPTADRMKSLQAPRPDDGAEDELGDELLQAGLAPISVPAP